MYLHTYLLPSPPSPCPFSPFPQLSSDSDSNVRYGAELLDRLMKVSPAESLRSVHVYVITYVHNGGGL